MQHCYLHCSCCQTHQIRANGLLAQNNRQGEQETALEVPSGVYLLPFCVLDVENFHLLTAWITTTILVAPKRVFANENEHFTPSKLAFYYLAAPCNSDSFNINDSESSFPSKKRKRPPTVSSYILQENRRLLEQMLLSGSFCEDMCCEGQAPICVLPPPPLYTNFYHTS